MKAFCFIWLWFCLIIFTSCCGKPGIAQKSFESDSAEFQKIALEFMNNPYHFTQIVVWSGKNYKIEKDFTTLFMFDEVKNYYDKSTYNFLFRTYYKTLGQIVAGMEVPSDGSYRPYIGFLVKYNLGAISKNYQNRIDTNHPVISFNERGWLDLGKRGVCYSPKLALETL